jgi:hypothetical protein
MVRRYATAVAVVLSLVSVAVGFAATQGGPIPVPLPLFPQNNWWNTDISSAPVDSASTNFITHIGANTSLHPDFGGNNEEEPGKIYGMPFIIVDGTQPKLTVDFVEFSDQSDGVNHNTDTSFPFYPIPTEAIATPAWIEGGEPGNQDPGGDRHMLIVDKTNNHLYELYHSHYTGSHWEAGSGAFYDMNTNNRRPDTWTSADAAGLAILPGLLRYDEVNSPGEIRHAIRMTVDDSNHYVFPASHHAGSASGALPMGARLRLKASKNISGFPADIQKIFRAFKKYGLIVADNGSDMFIGGTYDTRWNNDILNPNFGQLKASDFEVIQLGWKPAITYILTLPAVTGANDATSATLTAYDQNYNVATGYTGTVHFTSSDGAATLPADYTFTPGDAGVHTFNGGFTMRTAGAQFVTFTDTITATNTGSAGTTVGPATPTGLTANANNAQAAVTWTASAGATQYEVARTTSAATPFATVGTVATTNYTDNTVSAGTTYIYKVRALDASSRQSPYSAPDATTTIVFTDDPAVASTTVVKAIHITELRQAVNAMRTAAGLGASSFTDPTLTGGVLVKAVHLQELRAALNPARTALGLSASSFTDPTLTPQTTVVKAAHVQELRAGVK